MRKFSRLTIANKDLTNPMKVSNYDINRKVKHGLIDQDRILNFNVDAYYDSIINKKGQVLTDKQQHDKIVNKWLNEYR